jgi:NADH-quinone oxidoreductase subunit L
MTKDLGYQLATYAIWIVALPVLAALAIFILQVFLPGKIRAIETYKNCMKLLSILAIGSSAVLATVIFAQFWMGNDALSMVNGSHVAQRSLFTLDHASKQWFNIGGFNIQVGVLLDNMSVTVLFMVTWVACLIQIFSWGYMKGEDHIVRYYCFHSLFVASMLGMVASDNFLTFLISWEIMGLCSYLLIGFFWRKKSANNAQKKAFLTTRIGDLGFFLGVFIIIGIWIASGKPITFRFEDFANLIKQYGISDISFAEHIRNFNVFVQGIPMYLLTAAALLLFMGTVGKSAQFPLHIWLPDAMEGPTPVSALIHAATMVAAGVYLVARTYFVFDPMGTGHSPALVVVAYIGAITALGAALIGVTQYDIKRVLAYSTISQLGYMVLGLGVGAMGAAVFHLASHAYFKALLFLGSGAVIYGCHHVQDMRYMGGLRKYMPITFVTFLAGTLALMGFPGTSGFFSKDMILHHAFVSSFTHSEYWIIYIFGVLGATLTCFYMTRQIWMVFFGENRRELIPESERHGHSIEHMKPHEPPWVMLAPLVILATFAIFYGLTLAVSKQDTALFASSLYVASHGGSHQAAVQESPKTASQGGEHATSSQSTEGSSEHGSVGKGEAEVGGIVGMIPMALAIIAVFLGIGAGYRTFFFPDGRQFKESLKKRFAKLYDIVYNKYYCDEYIQVYVIEKFLIFIMLLRAIDMYIIDGFVNGVATVTVLFTRVTRWFDQGIVDGLVNGVAAFVDACSRGIRYMQSGYVQNYYMLVVVSILVYMLIFERASIFNVVKVFNQVWIQLGF